ncbi:MAG: hypothetical protein AB1598_06035 [Thermodesulfobacteriota bacterium]
MEDLMWSFLRPVSGIALILLIISVALLIPSSGGSAWAQADPCNIRIFKLAERSGDTVFFFEGYENGVLIFDGGLPGDGMALIGASFGFGTLLEVVELPSPGWQIAEVICEGVNGITITETEEGFTAACNVPGGFAECTVVNERVIVENIPTLSEWGMISAIAGLGLVGVWFAVRRRRAAV